MPLKLGHEVRERGLWWGLQESKVLGSRQYVGWFWGWVRFTCTGRKGTSQPGELSWVQESEAGKSIFCSRNCGKQRVDVGEKRGKSLSLLYSMTSFSGLSASQYDVNACNNWHCETQRWMLSFQSENQVSNINGLGLNEDNFMANF